MKRDWIVVHARRVCRDGFDQARRVDAGGVGCAGERDKRIQIRIVFNFGQHPPVDRGVIWIIHMLDKHLLRAGELHESAGEIRRPASR